MNIITVRGEFVLKSEETVDMAALIENNVEGLRQRSVYALAKQDVDKSGRSLQHGKNRRKYSHEINTVCVHVSAATDGSMYLACKRGDLLQVDRDKHSPDEKLFRATNHNTNSSGLVSKDTLQFLPTLTKPSADVMVQYTERFYFKTTDGCTDTTVVA